MRGYRAKSKNADQDIIRHIGELRSRARSVYMSSGLGARAINIYRDWVIGGGLRMNSALQAEDLGLDQERGRELKRTIERAWKRWGSTPDCDADRMQTLSGLEQLAVKSWLMSGDVFVRVLYGPPARENRLGMRLGIIEADRVCTPDGDVELGIQSLGGRIGRNASNGNEIVDGVEINSDGAAVAYWVRRIERDVVSTLRAASGSGAPKKTWTRVERFGRKSGLPQILHIMSAERPDQRRGVSVLACVLENLIQCQRYTETEMLAALIQASMCLFITSESPSEAPWQTPADSPARDNPPPGQPAEIEIAPGAVNTLGPDEKIDVFNPQRPNTFLSTFLETVGKLVASGTSIPWEILDSQFSSSYSASRGSLLCFDRTAQIVRSWFVQAFNAPIFRAFLDLSTAHGLIQIPGYSSSAGDVRWIASQANWVGPSVPSLDETKTANALSIQISQGLITREQAAQSLNGTDWSSNVEQIARENAELAAAGMGTQLPSTDPMEDVSDA